MGESFEWVEIIEPSCREHMFANLKTGQCLWDPPEGVSVKPTHENQWWELYDTNTRRYYYYNATSRKTVWRKPQDGDIISLAKLQMLKAKEVRRKSSDHSSKEKETEENNSTITTEENLSHETQEIKVTATRDKRLSEPLKEHIENNKHIDEQESIEHFKNGLNDKDVLMRTEILDNLDNESESKEEELTVVDNFYSPEQSTAPEDWVEISSTKNMEAVPIAGFIYSDKKSSTLPRTKFLPNIMDKPKYSSLRAKAPPKPPRTNTNAADIRSSTVNNFSISIEKSPVKIESSSNTHAHNEETIYENTRQLTQDTFEISVQSSPRLTPRSVEKPKRPPPSNPLQVQQAIEVATHGPPSLPTVSPKPSSPQQHIPDAPLPPQIIDSAQRLPSLSRVSYNNNSTLSVYDNVKHNTLSVYDNLSDTDEMEHRNMSTSPPRDRNPSVSSDDTYTPSGTLLRSESAEETRSSCYERLHDTDAQVETPSQLPAAPDAERTPPVKRSPLTRMKSDTLDIEKRAKFSKTFDVNNAAFRPVSMLNLSSAASNKPKRLNSDSDIPEQVPLSTHRKGLLRRRMSIHSMLSWSKTPIKKPMVLTRDKQRRKESVEVFKLILQCMGDKSSRKSNDALSVDITTKGWSTPALRDEIYIQLCKQTTGNDKASSLKRGWELLTVCLSMFPPSNKFHSYLEGYIYRNLEADEHDPQAKVDMYAKYCYKQLERICQTGAKRGLKGPTVEEIHAAIKRVFNPSMFGNTLEDILEMQQDKFPHDRLPWILTNLTEAVLLQNGLQTEGIFRVPGDIDEVNSLKLKIDKWQPPEHVTDPHVPASLLKLWFRDLYEPLIPQRFYDQCIHNCENADICLNIVQSLPPRNNLVFSYLIRLLQAFMIPDNVAKSKMDENNLAMVWAPNCLRCPSNDPREIFENTRKEMTFLRTIMKCLDTSFLEGVV